MARAQQNQLATEVKLIGWTAVWPALQRATRSFRRWSGIQYNKAETVWFDLKNGTDTRGKTPAHRLDIPRESTPHVTGFQSVNEHHLRTVLTTIRFPPSSTFVDIGCGKGKALLIATQFPFVARSLGIELAGSLCRTAEENIKRAEALGRSSKPIKIIHGDALQIDLRNGENIFFLNNPFDLELMKRMIDKIHECAGRRAGGAWLLYGNPAHHDALKSDERLKLVREFKFFGPGRNINVYQL